MAFCDFSHTFHKQVTDVPHFFRHPTVVNYDVSPNSAPCYSGSQDRGHLRSLPRVLRPARAARGGQWRHLLSVCGGPRVQLPGGWRCQDVPPAEDTGQR